MKFYAKETGQTGIEYVLIVILIIIFIAILAGLVIDAEATMEFFKELGA